VSPSTLRRYRAERLLRQEFGGLREAVLGSVRGRLRARGVHLDGSDLEACYAQAWQGLYAAIAAGEEIANPGGWLAVVTFRRAIDEHRSARARGFGDPIQPSAAADSTHPRRAAADPGHPRRAAVGARARGAVAARTEPDLAAELDDRARLRHLFEALRSRLSARECEAASLCYLQGLTRAQAAERMGISEARMAKLMEGRGPGAQGVAGKVGELLEAISGGEWCEQQASLMRGFAFGILDPRGERYRLARLHQSECPACRALVLSLRGLAAVLPPLPFPWALGLGAPHTLSTHAPLTHAPPTHAPPTHAPTDTPPTHAVGAKAGASAGAVSASGAAGVGGAAGGGWLLGGGSVGAKLAVSCLLALSLGCVAITAAPRHAGAPHRGQPRHGRPAASAYLADAPAVAGSIPLGGAVTGRSPAVGARGFSKPTSAARAAAIRRAAARRAQREFGPEQPAAAAASADSPAPPAVAARAARRGSPAGSPVAPAPAQGGPPSHAEREFGP
jgi:DNA-directed RNA polymerase specialized sigma24 family protein